LSPKKSDIFATPIITTKNSVKKGLSSSHLFISEVKTRLKIQKSWVSYVFCHRRVAHGGQLINLASPNICEEDKVCSSHHIKNKDAINMKDVIIAISHFLR